MSDSDRLVLDVTVVENTRDEDYNDFETILAEMFSAAYDDVECNVRTEKQHNGGDS